MIKAEVLELKKRFKKDKNTITKVAGCYVDGEHNKVCEFVEAFQSLPEEDMFKYLEILNKTLSGNIDNNLLNLEFPIDENETDKNGEIWNDKQKGLYTLMNSDFESQVMLDAFYDNIIESYNKPGNFLILLFLDKYDVPVKTKDKLNLDESEEIFTYVLCSICPVELEKPGLGYIDKNNTIAARVRDWMVETPDVGFMYPAFNDRSTDIWGCLYFTKDSKSVDRDFALNVLGCDVALTDTEKRTTFESIIRESFEEGDSAANNAIIDIEYAISQLGENNESVELDETKLEEVLKDHGIGYEREKDIKDKVLAAFEDNLDSKSLFSASSYKEGALRAEFKALNDALDNANKKLADAGNVEKDNFKETLIKTKNKKIEHVQMDGKEFMKIGDYLFVAADKFEEIDIE